MKKIVLIPPNGILKKQDFLYQKLSNYLREQAGCSVVLLCLNDSSYLNKNDYTEVIILKSENELIDKISTIEYDHLICRGWMHAYSFCAEIVNQFENVIVMIKDWNFSEKDEYQFLFGNSDDFNAINEIFCKAKLVLSHYNENQSKKWSDEYNVDQSRFLFFPEYCNKNKFLSKQTIDKQNKTINLVFAGTIPPSSYPEEFYFTKGIVRSVKKLAAQDMTISLVVPPEYYQYICKENSLYKDVLYENKFNNNFNLIQGEELNAAVINNFDYGFFILEYTNKNEYLNKYAVPSKFAFYLEAGIPMIINEKHEALSEIIKTNNLGLVFCNDDLNKLGSILRKITQEEYSQFIKNIQQYRNNFVFENHLEWLS